MSRRFREHFNVKDFGAKGDGVTDDTAAFVAAEAAVTYGGGVAGGCIYVPAGNYIASLSSTKANLAIVGEPAGRGQDGTLARGSTQIIVPDGQWGFKFNSAPSSTMFRGPCIRDIIFRANSAASLGGIWIGGCCNWEISNSGCCDFTAGIGILVNDTVQLNQYGTIFNPVIGKCQVGIKVVAASGCEVFGGLIDPSSNAALPVAGTTGILLGHDTTSVRLFGTRIQGAEIGLDDQTTTAAGNEYHGTRTESCTTHFKIASDGTRFFGAVITASLMGGGGTGIDIQATADATMIIYPYIIGFTTGTQIIDNGTNTVKQIIGEWQTTPSGQITFAKNGPIWRTGTGAPEGAITGPVGSLYTRKDGGAGTSLYVKESGTGATGWATGGGPAGPTGPPGPPNPELAARGLLGEPFHPSMITTGIAPATQAVYAVLVGLRAGTTVGNIIVYMQAVAAGTVPTRIKLGLYSKTGTLLADTGDVQTSSQWVSPSLTGPKVFPLTTPYPVTTDDGYYVAFLENGTWGTTQLALATVGNTSVTGTGTAVGSYARWNALQTGQTDLPNPATLVATIGIKFYIAAGL